MSNLLLHPTLKGQLPVALIKDLLVCPFRIEILFLAGQMSYTMSETTVQ
ncbi:hypothetical protein A2U01_0096541, partial [Trifolium medium]|nr:hypothetical protein [Trifolium medium]